MYTIIRDTWGYIASMKPAFISMTPHFNFITLHYFWIIGMAILGSVCLYPHGGIAYIDALFLASGAATQSGLNTVNINSLNTWQQIVLYIIPLFCNPISINSSVVFIRLYWFEKRFQRIAIEATKNRRSRAKTPTKEKTEQRDIGQEERGVQGRTILVMHNPTKSNGMKNDGSVCQGSDDVMEKANTVSQEHDTRSSNESEGLGKGKSLESGEERARPNKAMQHTQIKFSDRVKRSNGLTDEALRTSVQRTQEDHIAFLERQRNPDDDTVLRIPGPRDADAGVAPTAVGEDDTLNRVTTRRDSRGGSEDVGSFDGDHKSSTEQERPRNITIEEPTRPPAAKHLIEDARAATHVFGVFRLRKPRIWRGTKVHQDNDEIHPTRSRVPTLQILKSAFSKDKDEGIPYLSWEPTIGRNSAFVDLTESQREELGGIEYRSLKTLALILTLYFWGWNLVGILGLTPWIMRTETWGSIIEQDGQGRVWWAFFTANSAFSDVGFTLTPDSMISFQGAIWPLLLMSFLIIIGNTGFPIMLRITIWVCSKVIPRESGIYEELKFLLDHPRRCFTLLFPSMATWWLFWILVILNGLDVVFFVILDLGRNTIVTDLPVHVRVLDGWFQAVSTRTAGFGVVDLAELHPAIQVSYLIMMYISVLPIAISVRRTNVYEEKSLGIWGSAADENEDEGEPSYVGAHLRRQLSFDLWYIFLGLFIIAIVEGSRLQSGDPAFTMFTVLFEIVSAYGTVGLSLGYTGIDASFSAELNVISKLVIIAMQIRGRHRGLPYELDRAILLPSEHLQEKEEIDASNRARRRNSIATMDQDNGARGAPARGDRGRSRSRRGSKASNLLGSLLHPGPTIPNSHRKDPNFRERRNSKSTFTSGRDGGIDRPLSSQSYPSQLDVLSENPGQGERRSFYQDSANPPAAEKDV